ncbi:MAG: hypothetical protein AAF843_12770 [Bacteroidota bacterium]
MPRAYEYAFGYSGESDGVVRSIVWCHVAVPALVFTHPLARAKHRTLGSARSKTPAR